MGAAHVAECATSRRFGIAQAAPALTMQLCRGLGLACCDGICSFKLVAASFSSQRGRRLTCQVGRRALVQSRHRLRVVLHLHTTVRTR